MKSRLLIIAGIVVVIISVLVLRTCSAPSDKGRLVYEQHCANCHGDNGEGFAMYPPLLKADYLDQHSSQFACITQYGLKEEIMVNGKKYNQAMPANLNLSSTDITNLANYVYQTFSTSGKTFTQDEIKKQLENCQ